MKNKKKLTLLILILLILSILIIFIVNIYAKYLTNVSGNTSIPISKWNIKVNNLSIKENKDFSSTLAPVFPGNEYIASDIIAPSAEGYFDLNFDFTDVDVSFKYDISTSAVQNSPVQDLIPIKYTIDNGPEVNIESTNFHIIDTIPFSQTTRTRNIRIYIKWDDSESSTMDNAADTIATNTDSPATCNVKISFTQITEENH